MDIREIEGGWVIFTTVNVKDQLKDYIYDRTLAAIAKGNSERRALRSITEIEDRKHFLRESMKEIMGGIPETDVPLDPKITGVIKENGFRIEKVIFQARKDAYVTCNLYIPENLKKPCGAVLFVCGHHSEGKHCAEYQTVCRYLVKAGLIVLAQDPPGQGERFEYYDRAWL